MSTTTDSSATMAGAASTESSPAAGDALAAQVQTMTPEQMRKAAAALDLDKVEALLKRRRELLNDVRAKYAAMQADLESTQAAKAQLEAEAQQHAEELEVIDQKTADLQAQLNEAEAERLKLETDLGELSNLAEADDEQLQAFADKVAAGSSIAVIVATLQKKNAALKDANAQLAAAQEQLAAAPAATEELVQTEAEGAAIAAPTDGEAPQITEERAVEMTDDGTLVETSERAETVALEPEVVGEPTEATGEAAAEAVEGEPELASEPAEATGEAVNEAAAEAVEGEPELASEPAEATGEAAGETGEVEPELSTAELEALKQQLDAARADRDSAEAMIDERDGELVALRAQLAALTAAPLPKQISDFKAAARTSAENLGIEPRGVTEMQDLVAAKHIGATYEQRLYRAGVGTYWELAHLTDDDFELILRLTPMQSLAMNADETRATARQLAEDSESVGAIWEGDVPDDFEPIPGIGKVFEQRLYDAGIRTYKDLANASPEQLAEICKARKPIQPDYAGWARQARKLMEVRNT